MFSHRLYSLLALVLYFGKRLDISTIRLNKPKHLLYCDKSKCAKFNLYRNFSTIMLYYVGICVQIVIYYARNDLDRMNLALPFLFGITTLILAFSILVFFYKDLCAMFNGLTELLRYFHSKLVIYQNNV